MRRDTDSVADIVIAARRAVRFVGDMSRAAFEADDTASSAVLWQLEVIGEAATRISAEFRAEHDEIPWRKLVGTRNVLIHSYHRVDLGEVWRVATQELPPLVIALEALLPPPPGG